MAIIKRRKVTTLKKVSTAPLSLLRGADGSIGLPGVNGVDGRNGTDGNVGLQGDRGLPGLTGTPGKDGLPGKDGKSVALEDVLSKLKKEKKEMKSPPYPGGMTGAVVYTAITTTSFSIPSHNLIPGINIFGVNTSAPTTIYLPKKIREGVLITIKDESSSAATNNITIEKLT